MPERYFQHTFSNGLTLLCEKMPGVQSAAMAIQLVAGAAGDPPGKSGCATVLADLVIRGAGDRDTRQLSDHLDRLGLHRSSGVGVHHARFACEAVAGRVMESIPAYADIIRRPQLPKTGFEAARDLALQALESLADDPRQMLLVKLRQFFLPAPFGRNPVGEVKDLKSLTLKDAKTEWQRRYQASGAILAVAGNVDFDPLKSEIEKYFADLPSAAPQGDRIRSLEAKKTPRIAKERTDPHRRRLPVRSRDRPRLLRRPPRHRSSRRRNERPPLHRNPRKTRPLLQRLGRV